MPLAVSLAPRVGFCGKLPARGDFVTRSLPRGFVDPWDAWLETVIPGSRSILGEEWLPCWREAPIWRFGLPAGHAGPDAVGGVLLPSIDRSGRPWPLTLAVVLPSQRLAPVLPAAWTLAAEAAGLAAILRDAEPDEVMATLGSAAAAPWDEAGGMAATWWTEGAPRVPPQRFSAAALPGAASFASMLRHALG